MNFFFLSYSDLKPKKGIRYTRQHIAKLRKQKRFPALVELGPATKADLDPVIDEYLRALAAGYSQEEATELAEQLRLRLTARPVDYNGPEVA